MGEFLNPVQTVNDIYGWVGFLIAAVGGVVTFLTIAWMGLFAWYRIGRGLAKRKIAIFAEAQFEELKHLLVDSRMIKEKNISKIGPGEIGRAQSCSLYLVHYAPFKDKIEEILARKRDSDALIVYAPPGEGRVEPEIMTKVNEQRNSTVVNFRGRLLNDIFTSMVTTSFK